MKKTWICIAAVVFLTLITALAAGCTSRAVAAEAAQSMIELSKQGVARIDSDTATLDEQLYDTQVDIQKLQQVLNPALEWIDYQKTISRPGKWDITVRESGLEQFQNDVFGITQLEVVITRDSLQVVDYTPTIKVIDFRTSQTDNATELLNSLTASKDTLEQNRGNLVTARDLSVATVNNLLKYVNDWKIKKVSGANYNISGPALGWSGQLTSGTWEFNREDGMLLPKDKPAEDLNAVILGE